MSIRDESKRQNMTDIVSRPLPFIFGHHIYDKCCKFMKIYHNFFPCPGNQYCISVFITVNIPVSFFIPQKLIERRRTMIRRSDYASVPGDADLVRPRNRKHQDVHKVPVQIIVLNAVAFLLDLRIIFIEELL